MIGLKASREEEEIVVVVAECIPIMLADVKYA